MGRERLEWRTHESESTDARRRGGPSCSSDEVLVMRMERRGWGQLSEFNKPTGRREERVSLRVGMRPWGLKRMAGRSRMS